MRPKLFSMLLGASVGLVVGFALELEGLWPVLPAILGCAVGLVTAPATERPSWYRISGLRRKRRNTPL
jgi:hypothetical protein